MQRLVNAGFLGPRADGEQIATKAWTAGGMASATQHPLPLRPPVSIIRNIKMCVGVSVLKTKQFQNNYKA